MNLIVGLLPIGLFGLILGVGPAVGPWMTAPMPKQVWSGFALGFLVTIIVGVVFYLAAIKWGDDVALPFMFFTLVASIPVALAIGLVSTLVRLRRMTSEETA